MTLPTRTLLAPVQPRPCSARLDGLALDVEHAGLEEDVNHGLHALYWIPPWITVGISFITPRRRATSV